MLHHAVLLLGSNEGDSLQLLEYAETDEDYYFDYESYKEKKELYTEITNFEILTEDPDAFLEALEEFCEEWAIDGNYEFTVAGEEEEE